MTDGGILETIRGRRSVRKFRPEPVPLDVLRRIVEAGTWAPSAGNRQSWEFTVVTSGGVKAEMAAIVRQCWQAVLDGAEARIVAEEIQDYSRNFDWFAAAPALIVVSAKRPEAFLTQLLDAAAPDVAGTKTSAAMAAENLMLAAHALGLGACCLTGPLAAQDELRKRLGLGSRQALVCVVALGYPAEQPAAPARKPLSDVMRLIA